MVDVVEVTSIILGGLPKSPTEGLACGHASYSPMLTAI